MLVGILDLLGVSLKLAILPWRLLDLGNLGFSQERPRDVHLKVSSTNCVLVQEPSNCWSIQLHYLDVQVTFIIITMAGRCLPMLKSIKMLKSWQGTTTKLILWI